MNPKRRHHFRIAVFVGLVALTIFIVACVTNGIIGNVSGIYVGVAPSSALSAATVPSNGFQSTMVGLTFYGQVAANSTATSPNTVSYSLFGFQDYPCFHTKNASLAPSCSVLLKVQNYHLIFSPGFSSLPPSSTNIVQVNGTLVVPSPTVGSAVAPGGDVQVSAWRTYITASAPPTTSLKQLIPLAVLPNFVFAPAAQFYFSQYITVISGYIVDDFLFIGIILDPVMFAIFLWTRPKKGAFIF